MDVDEKVIPLNIWWRKEELYPIYKINGRLLSVELNGGALCDDYTTASIELGEEGAVGYIWSSYLVGSDYVGKVVVDVLTDESL